MKILAIETSCDETACAIVEGQSPTLPVKVLSNVVASSEKMHIKTGGIVPEVAAREQMRCIIPLIAEAITKSSTSSTGIDAIAVTVGPGLVGSLLVGVETAKALAYVWNKPIIPVNHLIAHLYANFVGEVPKFPAIGLVVSGGHTDLVLVERQGKITWIGGTRDDAAGECFDKAARMLGLPYPGGPAIAAEAAKSDGRSQMSDVRLPRPLLHEDTFDFSFSGLKTAVRRAALAHGKPAELAYELQEAVTDVLVAKLEKATEKYKPKSVLLGGGVAANKRLRDKLDLRFQMSDVRLFIPPVELCTDNAVSIGVAALRLALLAQGKSPIPWQKVAVDPGLEIG